MAHWSTKSFLTDWRGQKINLLCCGFVRSKTLIFEEFQHFPCEDISSIITHYVTDFDLQAIYNHHHCKVYCDPISRNIIINLKHTWKNNDHTCSMIIFQPFVSQLLNRSFSGVRLTVKHTAIDCPSIWYCNGGYFIEYGLIGVPKPPRAHLKDNINNCNNDKNCLALLQNIEKTLKNFQKMQFGEEKTINRMNFFDIDKKHKSFAKFCTHFLRVSHYTIYGVKRSYFGTNDDAHDHHLSKNTRALNLEQQDSISICVDCEKQHLYFDHNGTCFKETDLDQNSITENGIIKLDFEKYYYLFALSSIRCACDEKQNDGFRFSVSVNRL